MGTGVMVCPPYTSVVGKFLGKLFIADTHVISNPLDGTENGVVIILSSMVHFLQWSLCRLESSGVKTDSHHEIFQTSFPPSNTAQAEDNTTIHVDTHQDLPIDTYEETTVENETYFSFNEQEKNKPSDWSQVELKYWGKHNLPYLDSLQKKLTNTEMFAIVKSSIKTGSRVLHDCRRNAVFVIDTQRLNDLDDVKSNLNGTFQKSLEAKWKAVTVELKEGVSVKIISNKKEQLQENQISMKVSRSKNRHGLVRNIVYFLNKNSKVVNSKLVLQYYINKKV